MKFKRILLKLSGEALAGEKGHGIDNTILSDMASEIASIVKQGVQVALVIGGLKFLLFNFISIFLLLCSQNI